MPAQDDLRCFAFALPNIHGQLLGGKPLLPGLLERNPQETFPYGLHNAVGYFQGLWVHHGVLASVNNELLGVIKRPNESFFDLFDQGSKEDSDTESSAGNNNPTRECHIAQLVPTPDTGAAGGNATGGPEGGGLATGGIMGPALNTPPVAAVGGPIVNVPMRDGGRVLSPNLSQTMLASG
ncbi:hypothetical protein PR202_ga00373 [Eleusine coracana subsp. coracana]|uniref:Uncharacterized protein n=1 Tax=Eleusine coracana subsp. coracana TaxID=191504 RepID=A0AAV5BGC9_ELECO|nr:hypothetical protein PR202_ga00373 [Eleusine coracana subsp. coracana]